MSVLADTELKETTETQKASWMTRSMWIVGNKLSNVATELIVSTLLGGGLNFYMEMSSAAFLWYGRH